MRTLAIVTLLTAPLALAQTTYIQDPLTASSFTGRNSQGGSFGTSGWTTSAQNDTIWYVISDALESGRFEYTATGLQLGTSLSGGDQDIFSMYQAPSGFTEPIPYSPGFRNNDFKVFTRINGSLDPSRPGSMKIEMATCPEGDPWYHGSCDPGCGQDLIAYANGNQNDVGWDPAASYRMAVQWGNGTLSFERDGVTLGSVQYTGTYAPQPLVIRLGSPRNENVDATVFMPPGVTFSNVVITGTAGQRTLACGQVQQPPPPDAGTPLNGNTLGVIQDVTGATFTPGVFPDVTDLNVEADGNGGPDAIVFLRFPPLPGPVLQAQLSLHTQTSSSAAGGSGQPCALADSSWLETTLTWANQPAIGACVGAASSVTPDQEVSWDVTSLVQAGAAGFALVSHDANGAHYMSKEGAPADHAARLIFVLDPNVTPPDAGMMQPPPPDAGQAIPDAGTMTPPDAGAPPGSGTGGGGGTIVNPPPHDNVHLTGQCGCGSVGSPVAGLLLLVGWTLSRRRQRARLVRAIEP